MITYPFLTSKDAEVTGDGCFWTVCVTVRFHLGGKGGGLCHQQLSFILIHLFKWDFEKKHFKIAYYCKIIDKGNEGS